MYDAISSDNENQSLTRLQQENEDELPQPPPAQHIRIVLKTYDSQHQTHFIFRSPRINEVFIHS